MCSNLYDLSIKLIHCTHYWKKLTCPLPLIRTAARNIVVSNKTGNSSQICHCPSLDTNLCTWPYIKNVLCIIDPFWTILYPCMKSTIPQQPLFCAQNTSNNLLNLKSDPLFMLYRVPRLIGTCINTHALTPNYPQHNRMAPNYWRRV